MKAESIKKAYDELSQYSINEVALNELRKLTTDGVVVKISQETMFDRIVNLLDNRRVILQRKSDILHHFYKDSSLAHDLTLDHQSSTLGLNLLTYGSMLGLTGYTLFTYIAHPSPFLKLPGLFTGLLAFHCLNRHFQNNSLEKRLELPWKIHTYRMSKGLGPTNVRSKNKDFYTTKKMENYLHNKTFYGEEDDYLHMENKILRNNVSIYKKNSPYPIYNSFKNHEFNKDLYSFSTIDNDKNRSHLNVTTNESISDLIKENTKNKNAIDRIATYNTILMKPQTYLSYETFEPSNPQEYSVRNVVNYQNKFDNPLLLSSSYNGSPSYTDVLFKSINFSKRHLGKFYFDISLNFKLNMLQRKLHYLRMFGVDESELRNMVDNFNMENEKFKNQFVSTNDSNTENKAYLVHSEAEKNHLKSFFNFLSKFKVQLLKPETKEEQTFDYNLNTDNYDPWDEYKATYNDLFIKGRKYFIVESMPEWKFLQVRKPRVHDNDFSLERKHDYYMQDSLFHFLSLERYHRERSRKENLYHQETTTHKI